MWHRTHQVLEDGINIYRAEAAGEGLAASIGCISKQPTVS
jgi:hypothetical protein